MSAEGSLPDPNALMSPKVAATYMAGASPSTVRKWMKHGYSVRNGETVTVIKLAVRRRIGWQLYTDLAAIIEFENAQAVAEGRPPQYLPVPPPTE